MTFLPVAMISLEKKGKEKDGWPVFIQEKIL